MSLKGHLCKNEECSKKTCFMSPCMQTSLDSMLQAVSLILRTSLSRHMLCIVYMTGSVQNRQLPSECMTIFAHDAQVPQMPKELLAVPLGIALQLSSTRSMTVHNVLVLALPSC